MFGVKGALFLIKLKHKYIELWWSIKLSVNNKINSSLVLGLTKLGKLCIHNYHFTPQKKRTICVRRRQYMVGTTDCKQITFFLFFIKNRVYTFHSSSQAKRICRLHLSLHFVFNSIFRLIQMRFSTRCLCLCPFAF